MNISNTGPIKKALAEPLSLLTAETRACLVHALVLAWAALVFRCSPGRVVRAEVTQLSYHYSSSFTRLMIWTEFPLLGWGSLLLADGPCAIHFPFCWDVSQNHSKPSIPALAFFWEEDLCWVSGSYELQSGAHPGMGVKSWLHFKAFLKKASYTPLVKQMSIFYLSAWDCWSDTA